MERTSELLARLDTLAAKLEKAVIEDAPSTYLDTLRASWREIQNIMREMEAHE